MKNYLIFIFSLSLIPQLVTAQDITTIIKEAENLDAQMKEKPSFEKYKEALFINPQNTVALNKCSELCSRIGKRENTQQQRNNYYELAKYYAETSLKIDPNNSASNCVMAIALGRITMEKSGREKINAAKNIKKHLDIALKNDPSNYKAWHVLGRWHYELSNLNIIERTAVKLFFGGMPQTSMNESIAAFEKANNLVKNFSLNYFELAKAYKKNDQLNKAIQCLNTILILPNKTEEDETIKADSRKLLKDWL